MDTAAKVTESEEPSLKQPDEVSNPLRDSLKTAVKKILEEQASEFIAIDNYGNMSEEDYDIIKSWISRDAEKAAAEITQLLVEGLNLESGDKPEMVPESEAPLCLERVETTINTIADEAACGATAPPNQEWDKLCEAVILGILKNGQNAQTTINTATTNLKSHLLSEIAGWKIAAQLSEQNIGKLAKAVCKDMHENISRSEEEWMYLLEQDALGCGYIVDSLKRHLMKPPKKNEALTFFATMYRVMSKPYTTPF